MQRIGVRHFRVWIQMKPLLAALLRTAGIPRENQTLNAAVRERHEILLKRKNAECVFDGIVGELAVGSVRANVVFAVLQIEAGGYSVFRESAVAKVSEHRG